MSIIVPTEPAARIPLPDGGFEIQGIEDRENQLPGSVNADRIVGGDLADILDGLDGADTIAGGGGDDGISGGLGNDSLLGENGNDTLNDSLGENAIAGGAGDDRLVVETGGSTLTGGAGRDIFQLNFKEQSDTVEASSIEELGITISEITDFEPGEDRIAIQGLEGTQAPIYNLNTGIVSLDDVEIAKLATNLNISEDDIEIVGNNNPLSIVDNSESKVYRFYDPTAGVHFYTADETERNYVTENLTNYQFEGESYTTVDPMTGGQEVYRFFNPATGVHLYTTSEVERDSIIETLPNFVFEGVKFFAYETQVAGSIPVYRFYEPTLGVHFYTPNETEKESVRTNLPNYNFEGIAYYALPVDLEEA